MSTKYRYNGFNENAAKVAVKFPAWHPFRSNPRSNWRKLLSPVYGDMLDSLNTAVNISNQDMFLATTNIEKPDTLYVSAIDIPELPSEVNLLKNSDFSQNTIDGYLYWQIGLNTYTQYTAFRVNASQTLNLLVSTTGITQVEVIGVRLDTGAPVNYIFNAFTTVNSILETYALEIEATIITGNIDNSRILLTTGDSNQLWSRNIVDTTYWLDKVLPSSFDMVGDNRPIYEVQAFTDMFNRTPATYAVLLPDPIPSDTSLNSGREFLEFKTEFHGDLYPAYLDVSNNKIRKLIDKSVEYLYDLHEMKANGLISFSDYLVDAIYLADDYIIAIARKPILASSSSSSSGNAMHRRYILWISADHPTPEDGILQIIKSIPLDVGDELSGSLELYSKINDQYSLVVSNTDNSITTLYSIDLKYDYYTVDNDRQELIFREKYTTIDNFLAYSPSYQVYYQALDEHGLMRGLPRIRYEKNYDYKQRLLNYSNRFRTNSSFEGLSNGINLRLGYKIVQDVLTFADNLHIYKNEHMFYVANPTTTAVEILARDPNYNRVALSQTPFSVNSVTIDGILRPSSLYKIPAGSNEIIFSDYPEVPLTASVTVDYVPYTTVFSLGTSSIKDLYDSLIFNGVAVESQALVSDMVQWPALNIMDINQTGTNISLTYYPVRPKDLGLNRLSAFQDLSIAKYEISALQDKVIDLSESMHDIWDKNTLDLDRWDMVTNAQIGGGTLPAYNDGIFSWLEHDGDLYGHVDNIWSNSTRQGFTYDQLSNGINSTLSEIEEHKDLQLIGFTSLYQPKVKVGFFFIKEMQFYLFANKQRYNIPTRQGWLIDIDAVRAANPTVEYTGFTGATPLFDEGNVYILTSQLAAASAVGTDTATGLSVSTALLGFELTATKYYLFEAFKEGSPIILTDLGTSLQHVQFSAKSSGLVELLNPIVLDAPLYIEYEPDTAPEFSILNTTAAFSRGYLYIELDSVYTSSVTTGTNFGLVNGPGKGICRKVYDPDVGLSAGIDFDCGPIIESESNITIADPTGPTSIPNPNLFYNTPVGWGHDWGIDFGN